MHTTQDDSRKPRRRRSPNPASALACLQDLARDYGPPVNTWRDIVARGLLPVVQFPSSRRIWVRRADAEKLIAASTEVRR